MNKVEAFALITVGFTLGAGAVIVLWVIQRF